MNYVGIDIGKERHAVAAIDDTGRVVLGSQLLAADGGGYASLSGLLRKLGPATDVLVGMEATGHYGKLLAHRLRADGWTVHVFNPAVIAAEAKSDLRGRKSDKLDALVIARTLRNGRRGQSAVTPDAAEQLKTLSRQRNFIVHQRTDAKNHLTALLDVLFPEMPGFFHDTWSASFLALVERFPSAMAVASADLRTLTTLLRKASRGKLGHDQATELKKTAQTSLARTRTNAGEEFAAQQTAMLIRFLDEHIERLEEQMLACPNEIATYLASIKGLGAILPLRIAGELGDLERFAGPNMTNRILAFAGCEPRIRESGKWKGRSKMSKRGSTALRCALFQAAHTARIHTPFFAEIYKRQIARGKAHAVAQSHVIRALVNTLCGMYKSKTLFCAPEIRKAG